MLVGMTAQADSNVCPHCGSDQSTKRVTRFTALRGEEGLLDDLPDRSKLGDMDDPQAMRRWAREVGKEMGEDLGGEFEEYLDAAEGESIADE